jgi:hypothetical protein
MDQSKIHFCIFFWIHLHLLGRAQTILQEDYSKWISSIECSSLLKWCQWKFLHSGAIRDKRTMRKNNINKKCRERVRWACLFPTKEHFGSPVTHLLLIWPKWPTFLPRLNLITIYFSRELSFVGDDKYSSSQLRNHSFNISFHFSVPIKGQRRKGKKWETSYLPKST